MGTPQRFLFNVSFDQFGPLDPQGAAHQPRFTQAELDAARADGIANGHSTALAEAAQSLEARIASAVEGLTQAVDRLAEERGRVEAEVERCAVALVRTVLQRAVPALAAKDPLEELEAFVTRILGEAFDEPRIVLRVSDALFEPVKSRLPDLSQAAGYSGKLVLLADPALAEGDGRLEWADGGAERDTAQMLAELDDILARSPSASSPVAPEERPHD